MSATSHLEKAQAVFDVEIAALRRTRARLDGAFDAAVETLRPRLAGGGKIIVTASASPSTSARRSPPLSPAPARPPTSCTPPKHARRSRPAPGRRRRPRALLFRRIGRARQPAAILKRTGVRIVALNGTWLPPSPSIRTSCSTPPSNAKPARSTSSPPRPPRWRWPSATRSPSRSSRPRPHPRGIRHLPPRRRHRPRPPAEGGRHHARRRPPRVRARVRHRRRRRHRHDQGPGRRRRRRGRRPPRRRLSPTATCGATSPAAPPTSRPGPSPTS